MKYLTIFLIVMFVWWTFPRYVEAVISAPTFKTNFLSTSQNPSANMAAFAVTEDDLIIISGMVLFNNSPGAITVTDGASNTYTVHQEDEVVQGSFEAQGFIATAIANSTATITVTINPASSGARWNVSAHIVTGHDLTTPITQSAEGEDTDGTVTVTLSSTPASNSMVFGGMGQATTDGGADITADGSYTEILESTSGGTTVQVEHQVQYDLDSADTTADWSSSDATAIYGALIEIAAADAGGGDPDPFIPKQELIIFD